MLTRESWLCEGVVAMRSIFAAADAGLPETIHVSVGFPSKSALSRTRRAVGQCWAKEASKDGNCHIYLSPVLETPVAMLDTLAHELVHVVTPGAGHRGQFIKVSRAVGLTEGKPKSASAGRDLLAKIERIASDLGPFPHPVLAPMVGLRKQTTRMQKCECPECGYTARTTRKWLESMGAPICPGCEVRLETIDRLNADSPNGEG